MKNRGYKNAWDTLKDIMLEDYPTVNHEADVSNGDAERGILATYKKILKEMDQLDGTHEFSNLQADMNRECEDE